ncbi:MAG: hypothetical protein KAJ03_05465 [Gammaproteobacteria bacterium]|nr:hypothetical protein [Gammaproteobacteria bacterium]
MSENWIDDLKPSDSVIVVGNGNQLDDILQVERLTKTQVVLINTSSRFSRSDGRLIGASVWNTQSLKMATPQRIEKIKIANRRCELIYFVSNTAWNEVSSEKLEEIVKTVKDLNDNKHNKNKARKC